MDFRSQQQQRTMAAPSPFVQPMPYTNGSSAAMVPMQTPGAYGDAARMMAAPMNPGYNTAQYAAPAVPAANPFYSTSVSMATQQSPMQPTYAAAQPKIEGGYQAAPTAPSYSSYSGGGSAQTSSRVILIKNVSFFCL